MTMRPPVVLVAGVVAALCVAAGAQPPSYGIDFVTVGSPGNAPCTLPDPGGWNFTHGRGSVPYEYRIGRTEVTTGQWLQFLNTYAPLGGSWMHFGQPVYWGAGVDPEYTGPGRRYKLINLPGAESMPVVGMNWRAAAMYCNWLHNGQAPGLWALQDGAYDASTFTTNPNGTFNDQLAHHPGARFWVPTLDEWLKAVHYDPDRHGQGQGGWWMYPNRSDTAPVYGPPGVGQANAGFQLNNSEHFWILLGSYPQMTSPWGLLDTAGSASEWLEQAYGNLGPETRGLEGSSAGISVHLAEAYDRVTRLQGESPWWGTTATGLRVASAVPSPGAVAVLLAACAAFPMRSSREHASGCPRVPLLAASSPRSSAEHPRSTV